VPLMSAEKKLLFFCAETFPPPYAFLQKVFNDYFREYGFHVVWVMPSTETAKINETDWEGNPVILIPKIQAQGLTDLFRTYWQHLKHLKRAARMALEHYGHFHIVQVRDDPAMACIGWRLSRILSVPFVYQISHLKEEEVMMYARMRIYGSPLKNMIQGKVGFAFRNFLLRRADLVLPISRQMKQTLISYGIPTSHVVTLPEGVDTYVDIKAFDVASKAIRKELGLQNKKIITYVGTLNRFRQLDFLLEVLKLVLQDYPEAHLLIVGSGKTPGDINWLKKRAAEIGVEEKVTFTGWVPKDRVSAYIRASDVGVSPFVPNRVLINNSPIKPLEYMNLEVPVVATDIPEQKKIIEESRAGICVPWVKEKFAGAIREILNITQEDRSAIGQRGRYWVQQHRDFAVLAHRVYRAYDDILKG